MKILVLVVLLFSVNSWAEPFRYSVKRKSDGVITNSWTSDKLPKDHYEPGFGPKDSYEIVTEDIGPVQEDENRKESVRQNRKARILQLARKWKEGGAVTNAERDELVKHLVLDYVKDLD